MTRTRRCVLLLVLTVAALIGASLPANALFSDSAATAVQPAIGTLTVQGPTNVRVETSCVTTTTTIRRVFDSSTNAQLSYQETRTTANSNSNVESDTTVRTDNSPTWGQYTLTRTIKDTWLTATARWNRSNSPGITGYQMTAFLNGGVAVPIGTAAASANNYSDGYDASVVDLGARLSMVTLTSYGWTASGNLSNVVTC
ncbi:hypothetical protein [Trujillonella humicola]|uniref:hypothetical protein n=1 Tax=Trujillonella humicola TaxID=3383699 RepID=UPI003906C855